MGYANGVRGPQNIMAIQRAVQQDFSIKRGKFVELRIRKVPKGNKRADKRFKQDRSSTFVVEALSDTSRAAQEALADAIVRLNDWKNECQRMWDLDMCHTGRLYSIYKQYGTITAEPQYNPKTATSPQQTARKRRKSQTAQPAKVADIGMPELKPPTRTGWWTNPAVKQPAVEYKPFVPRVTQKEQRRQRAENLNIKQGNGQTKSAKRGQTVQRKDQTARTAPALDSRARAFKDVSVRRAQSKQFEKHYYREEIRDICGEKASVKLITENWAAPPSELTLEQLETLYQRVCDKYNWNPKWYNGNGSSCAPRPLPTVNKPKMVVTKVPPLPVPTENKPTKVVTTKVPPLPTPMQTSEPAMVWENPTFSQVPTVKFPRGGPLGDYFVQTLPASPGLQRSESETAAPAS